ncbi:MAG: hypothetical protein HY791_03185 [Deltaproteobacteria bacterium]|nr:hypothetical protein [Deltaproteobacteria bacterium]
MGYSRGKRAILIAGAVTLVVSASAGARAFYRSSRFVTYSPAELEQVTDVHSFRGQPVCQACHQGRSPSLSYELIETCARCHAFDTHDSHAVGVVQRDPQPKVLPLGPGGVVGCHSCHDPHADMKSGAGLRSTTAELCTDCHAF